MGLAAAGVGCAEAPEPTGRTKDLRVGEEVYRIFCKRVARGEYPGEATGVRFNAPCEREGTRALLPSDSPRFVAMVQRREQLVAALDQVFGAAPIAGVTETFQQAPGDQGELDQFLKNLIPFYDDGTTPASTRAIAAMAKQLAEPTDPRANEVLAKLAELSQRQGYRPPDQTLAATKPLLTYGRIDDVSEKLLALLGQGGAGNASLLNILRAATLELADDSKGIANADSTMRVVTDLLFRTLRQPGVVKPADAPDTWQPPVYAETKATAPTYFLRRGDDGKALGSTPDATPFPVPGVNDLAAPARDPAGRLANYTYANATETVLAALLREQKPLLQRKAPGAPSTVEKLLRGLRPLLGTMGPRTYTFTSKRPYAFTGPNIDESPLLDFLHAGAALLQFPETERVLVLLSELIDKYESDANGTVYAGLAIDRIADADASAQLAGWDGTPNTASDFWDDLINVGQRMLERPGQLEAVLRSFGEPSAVAQTSLLAKFMQYKDRISYNGAPLTIGADGKYAAADATTMNSEITTQLAVPVDRSATGADRGMNRSLFQRLMSTIRATNGAPMCNKQSGFATVTGPLGNLRFPNADPTQMTLVNCALDPEIQQGLDCGDADAATFCYAECLFNRQPNGAESHMRSMLGRTAVVVKDAQLLCAAAAEIPLIKQPQDVGEEQEKSSQIEGFTLAPTPQAIARFVMAPRTKFITDLFDPFPTVYGVPVTVYEPDMLFALEARQNDILLNGNPASFLDASIDLGTAFDDHELFTDSEDGEIASDGYMFAELLGTLGNHWPSPRAEDCPTSIVAGDEGCTQRLDATKNFYAKQSNLVSYEPLLIKAIQDERLGAILQKATARLKEIWILSGTDGAISIVPSGTAGAKDGITTLNDFLTVALTPNDVLADRKNVKSTKTNACVPVTDAATGVASCQDNRGRIIPQTTPLYLLLDALNAIDAVWDRPENAERHKTFLEARSELIDQLLTVDRDDVTDPANPAYRMRNQRGRAFAIELVSWLRSGVLAKHPVAGDRTEWATGSNGIAARLRTTLSHPLVAFGLDLFDQVWADSAAGDELAAMNAYLMDYENNESAFLGLLLGAADALEFADREPRVAPVVQFGALALAPDAFTQIAATADPMKQPDVEHGAAYTGLELTRKVAMLMQYKGQPALSPISKILKNAVLTPANGRPPVIVLFDAIADVNRNEPQQPTTVPFAASDNQRVFDNLKTFMSDPDRGLERLYTVVSGRYLNGNGTQP